VTGWLARLCFRTCGCRLSAGNPTDSAIAWIRGRTANGEACRLSGTRTGRHESVLSPPSVRQTLRLASDSSGLSSSSVYPDWNMYTIEQTFKGRWSHPVRMKLKLLTSKQLSSVSCPTCGAPVGKSCVLHSGATRPAAHVDRRHSAAAAAERERF
jgi:hypothetical protein